MIRVDTPRTGARDVEFDAATADHTDGCGQPPPGVRSGRVCAGTGKALSCQLCPHSRNYFRDRTPRAHALRAALVGPDSKTPPPAPAAPDDDHDDAESEGRLL